MRHPGDNLGSPIWFQAKASLKFATQLRTPLLSLSLEKWLIPRTEKNRPSKCCKVPEKFTLQYIRNNTDDAVFKLILFLGCIAIFIVRAGQVRKSKAFVISVGFKMAKNVIKFFIDNVSQQLLYRFSVLRHERSLRQHLLVGHHSQGVWRLSQLAMQPSGTHHVQGRNETQL